MGKEGFRARHPHLPNWEKIWAAIEKIGGAMSEVGEAAEKAGQVLQEAGEVLEKVAKKKRNRTIKK